jgi:hypothetical protein
VGLPSGRAGPGERCLIARHVNFFVSSFSKHGGLRSHTLAIQATRSDCGSLNGLCWTTWHPGPDVSRAFAPRSLVVLGRPQSS